MQDGFHDGFQFLFLAGFSIDFYLNFGIGNLFILLEGLHRAIKNNQYDNSMYEGY